MTPNVPNVTVIDYGVGNMHSVVKGLRHEGGNVSVSARGEEIARADRLVLPGVGAFGDGMAQLKSRELIDPIRAFVASGKPFLGICLGMQLLLGESEEFGHHDGLGIIPGRVIALSPSKGLKIPHVGWNRIVPPEQRPGAWNGTCLEGTTPRTMFYFVHSFVAVPEKTENRFTETQYGPHTFVSGIRKDNVVGFQFHPEKSGPVGLAILNRFLRA